LSSIEDTFRIWRRWLKAGILSAPFAVIHVDAHADLGLGDGGWIYLLSDFLALPLEQRAQPRFARDALNSGNYLAFAIGSRWISRLTYVFPPSRLGPRMGPLRSSGIVPLGAVVDGLDHAPIGHDDEQEERPVDLMTMHFRNGDSRTQLIELRHFSPQDVRGILWETNPPSPIHVEPAVPFEHILAPKFEFRGFTHMIVAQSPHFTPPSADQLLPEFREYFIPA
jgi:hypothetical protein